MSFSHKGGTLDLSNGEILIILQSFSSSNSKLLVCISLCCSVKVMDWIVGWYCFSLEVTVLCIWIPSGSRFVFYKQREQKQRGNMNASGKQCSKMEDVCVWVEGGWAGSDTEALTRDSKHTVYFHPANFTVCTFRIQNSNSKYHKGFYSCLRFCHFPLHHLTPPEIPPKSIKTAVASS